MTNLNKERLDTLRSNLKWLYQERQELEQDIQFKASKLVLITEAIEREEKNEDTLQKQLIYEDCLTDDEIHIKINNGGN